MHFFLGYGSKRAHPALFQQRCYGSLMNIQKLELMYKLEEHEGCVNSLNFSPNGNLLASGSDDLKVCIYFFKLYCFCNHNIPYTYQTMRQIG